MTEVLTDYTTLEPEKDFENMKCAVYWLHQYCERTECDNCAVFGPRIGFEFNAEAFQCPFTVGIMPAEWALDGRSEIFEGYLDYLAELEDEVVSERISMITQSNKQEQDNDIA
jgi:hypothetical protein